MNEPASPNAFHPVPRIYDEVLGPVYFEGYAALTAQRLAGTGAVDVLETACGTGRLTRQLAASFPATLQLTATDLSPEMLNYAMEITAEDSRIHWLLADALVLPFENESFDAVACQFGVMFFPDKQQGFTEAYRVLRKQGTFLFSVWDRLERNPLAAVGREALRDFFDGKPPASLQTAFSMSDAATTTALLESCGFINVGVESIRLPCEASSPETFARAFVEGSSVRIALQAYKPDAVSALRDRIEEVVVQRFGSPVKSTQQALLFTATKP